jgi:hypothetical protein
VEQLAATIRERSADKKTSILKIVDTAENPRYQPLRASLLDQIPKFLKRPGPSDRVIIYFSGHGFRDDEGKLYLAPIDCDPKNPADTAIAVTWLREQLAACKAKLKLLILDACHSGSEKGEDESTSIEAHKLVEPFRGVEGVVTLASSSADQKSQIWEEKQQSLFSYWLNQGLKGHADSDGDAQIDIDELNKYVFRNVTYTAKSRFPREQTPIRIVRSGTPGVPVVLRLRPLTLKQVLSDISEELAWAAEERKLKKIGVLEFTNDSKLGELLGADFGLLGRYCAAEIERQLLEDSTGKFSVVSQRRLQSVLKSQQFSLDDLGSSEALTNLSSRVGNMSAVVLGTLRNRNGRVVHLQCKLLDTKSDGLAGSAGGVAFLNESEWAMLGRSVSVKFEDRRPPLPGVEPKSSEDRVIERLDERSNGPHPLKDASFPYRVKVLVNNKERKGFFRGNDYIVELHKGEVYSLQVQNSSSNVTALRLLVDGLNTLPEPEVTKGVTTYITAPPVTLSEARHWILDPKVSETFTIRGFVTKTGTEGALREFVVVDAEQSVASRHKFTEQIGLITAAFYAPKPATRSVGTVPGKERKEDLTERDGIDPGKLLAVIHIRYVDAESLRENADSK